MDLNTLWFILIAVLYTGFFVLEGFDFGVGMLLHVVGKTDTERRVVINTVGPHWDGNEVWLLTAGGATFAAFPHWYATLFSGFYLPLFLVLAALIVRGVAFEFRSKDDHPTWRAGWDLALTVGSFLPALLLGVAFANVLRGVPIDQQMHYVGGFFNLLNPFALLAGVTTVALMLFHGAIFLVMKAGGEVRTRASTVATRLWLPVVGLEAALLGAAVAATDILERLGATSLLVPLAGVMAAALAGLYLRKGRTGWAFGLTCLNIALGVVTLFAALFPRLMVSSLDPAWSLTIRNAASSPYTLGLMTTVAVIFVPLVLAYQAWSYWVFRKRVQPDPAQLTY
jgi:cytochrome d ubiquinol oxidase subunit II